LPGPGDNAWTGLAFPYLLGPGVTVDTVEFTLTDDQLAELGQINDFNIGFPMSFLTNDNVIDLVFGKSFAQIDYPHPANA